MTGNLRNSAVFLSLNGPPTHAFNACMLFLEKAQGLKNLNMESTQEVVYPIDIFSYLPSTDT